MESVAKRLLEMGAKLEKINILLESDKIDRILSGMFHCVLDVLEVPKDDFVVTDNQTGGGTGFCRDWCIETLALGFEGKMNVDECLTKIKNVAIKYNKETK